jgi:ankyrin repeat protein
VKLLLDKGANPKAVTRNGVNGIMMAANVAAREEDRTGRSKTQKDAIETITLLLAAGTDINGTDTQGRTALHGARPVGAHRTSSGSCTRTAPSSKSRTSGASRHSKPRSG